MAENYWESSVLLINLVLDFPAIFSNQVLHVNPSMLIYARTMLISYAANAILEGLCERVIVGELYCDLPLGLYVIHRENVVLIGELDLEKEDLPHHTTQISPADIKRVASLTCEEKFAENYNKSLTQAYNIGVNEGLATALGLGAMFFIIFCSNGLAIFVSYNQLVMKMLKCKNQSVNDAMVHTVFGLAVC